MDKKIHIDSRDQVYRTDRWSRYLWRRFLDTNPNRLDLLDRGQAKVYSFPSFAREVFHRLCATTEERVEKIRPEDQWAASAHDELGQLPDFERLRRRCHGDRLLAGEAAIAFAETVLGNLPDPQKPLRDPEPLRDQMRGLLEFAQRTQGSTDPPASLTDDLAALRQQGQDAVAEACAWAKSIDPSDLRNAIRAAIAAGHDAATEVEASVGAFCGWGTGAASPTTTSPEVKAELATRIRQSQKLKSIAREAGRLRRIAAAKQRSRADHARDEVCDIEAGADLARLLPSELVKLGDPHLWPLFAKSYHEKSLLQYRLSGKERQGRGPIVVCLDQSSSMRGAKEFWSKGLALALLQVAAMQRRTCRVVHFNTDVVQVDDWLPGKVDPKKLAASMEPFHGGGTSLEPPLRSALDAIGREVLLKKADVILVTDGEAQLPESFTEEWAQARKKLGFTCYAIHVEAPAGIVPPQLAAVADSVVPLADINDDTAATATVLSI